MPLITRINPVDMKTKLYHDLVKQILTLELPPGSSLDESRLSEEYQISRTPLRETFRKLAGEGYITIINNRGAYVAQLDYLMIRNFFLTAPILYTAVAQLAVLNRTPEQIDTLTHINTQFIEAMKKGDANSMVFQNDLFHRVMGEMAANPYLQPSYERLLIDHARISQTFYRPTDEDMRNNLDAAAEQHKQMIEAIIDQDVDKMTKLIEAHWKLSSDQMQKFVRPNPLQIDNNFTAELINA